MLPQLLAILLGVASVLAAGIPDSVAEAGTQPPPVPSAQARPEPLVLLGQLFERLSPPVVSPDGRQVVFAALDPGDWSHLYLVSISGGTPVALTSGEHNNRSPRFSSDGQQIVFLSDRTGNADIWTMPVSGGPPRQITVDPGDDLDPAWAPDGTRIVFASRRAGSLLLYIFMLSSLEVFPLTAGTGADRRPAWSPDGEWIAFESTRDGTAAIWVVPWTGGVERRLGPHDEEEWARAPSWSVDSQWVRGFASANRRLLLVDLPLNEGNSRGFLLPAGLDPRGSLPVLTPGAGKLVYLSSGGAGLGVIDYLKKGHGKIIFETAGVIRHPSWSPDSRNLVVVADWDGRRDLYRMGVGSGRWVRFTDSEVTEYEPSWSAKAGDILFTLRESSSTDSSIWLLEPETQRSIKVISSPGRNRQPAWSPDDRLLAYVSDRAGSEDLWVADVSGGEPTRLTALAGSETGPTWSPDGQWIAFSSDQGAGGEIWRIPSEGGDPVQITRAANGSSDLQPSWSSKGDLIAFIRAAGDEADIYIVQVMGGEPFPYRGPNGIREQNPAWSPGSTHLAYEWSKRDEFMVLELEQN